MSEARAPRAVHVAPSPARPDDLLKRAFDVAVAAALLAVAAPLLAALALLVRWKLGAPVLFTQERAGLGAAPFTLRKFRTMRPPAPGPWDPTTDAARLTPVGAAMRRWSLDELPQLWNVLTGDMSLVGPRPLPLEYLPRYSERQLRRHAVRPGITGWAQVRGRNAVDWAERFEHDLWYVEHRSFLLDLRILARTAATVVGGSGVSAGGEATMREFTGA